MKSTILIDFVNIFTEYKENNQIHSFFSHPV